MVADSATGSTESTVGTKAAPTALAVTGLQQIYRSDAADVEAVRDVSFELGRGELVCLVGPSGCGKTTLLRCFAGLLEPTSVTVTLDGTTVNGHQQCLADVCPYYGRMMLDMESELLHDQMALHEL